MRLFLTVFLIVPAWILCFFAGIKFLGDPSAPTLTIMLFLASGIGMLWKKMWSYCLMAIVSAFWVFQLCHTVWSTNPMMDEPGLTAIFMWLCLGLALYLSLIVLLCVWNLLRNIGSGNHLEQMTEK